MSSKQIRVLHIITHVKLGGAQENTLLSVDGLSRMPEYELSLMYGTESEENGELLSLAREKSNFIAIPEMDRSINPFSDLIAFFKIYRHIRKGQYHIVHTHSSKAGVLGRLAAWLAGTPIIVHTLHGLVFHDYQPRLVNRSLRLVKKMLAHTTDYYISVSKLIADKAIKEGIGSREKFRTIYSGMELDWFLNARCDGKAIRRDFGIPEDAPVVGKIARLFPLKGHDELMSAAPTIVRQFPNIRFFLVGDGILLEHLKTQARKNGISENFVFAGFVDRRRIPEMISIMDVVVHTSLREGLARVLPQALAIGKPCVSFDLDGAPEVVINDVTGYLVKAGDSYGLARAISRILENPELRRQMGENGRRRVDPAFRAETMVNEIAEVYQMLLKRYADRIEKFDAKTFVPSLDNRR
jgi:glycosyltransferase involved in cell wall biosynthesis